MRKKIFVLLIASFMVFGSGCATYNSIVPDWATISSTETNSQNKNDAVVWWNPFTWF